MAGSVDNFDIVLSFDTTGSMYDCIDSVKQRMGEIMRKLKKDIPGIKMGVIAHGDYDTDHTYIIKYENLTDDVDRLCQFVRNAEGTGGGITSFLTLDEAYELSLKCTRQKMNWRTDSNKVLVMIGDCRPHEKDFSLNKERIDWNQEIVLLRDMGVKINAVQCEGRSYADSFYQKIASTTFGNHVPLEDIKQIEKVLMSICYREAGLGGTFVASSSPTSWSPSLTQQESKHVVITDDSDDDSSDSDDDDNFGALLCPMCKVKKPADEFPYQTVSEHCEHAPLECLRCVVKYVSEHGKCPNKECIIEVDSNDEMMKFFQAKLDTMFVDYNKVLEKRTEMIKSAGEFISVSTITGSTEWLPYRPDMKIAVLKNNVASKLEMNEKQMRLIYNDHNLKSGAKLSDYSIGPYANLFVIVPLYCVPEHLDNVVFDLSWEFPDVNPDFLDATCFAFEKEEFVQVIDWTHPTNKYYLNDSIKHSEKNLTSAGQRIGHQTINVSLKAVPSNITHLYFTLSSWRSPNLSAFKNPSLSFYEAAAKGVNLCETTISHALSSQAVIMCSAVREGFQWQIFECSVRSVVEGNSKRYNPIRARISELIRDGL